MVEGQEGVSWRQWLALARAVEAGGLAALMRSDHYLSSGPTRRDLGALDAWGTSKSLAAVTDHVRLGTFVSPSAAIPPAPQKHAVHLTRPAPITTVPHPAWR